MNKLLNSNILISELPKWALDDFYAYPVYGYLSFSTVHIIHFPLL